MYNLVTVAFHLPFHCMTVTAYWNERAWSLSLIVIILWCLHIQALLFSTLPHTPAYPIATCLYYEEWSISSLVAELNLCFVHK